MGVTREARQAEYPPPLSRGFPEKEMEQCIPVKQTAYCPHCRAVTDLNISITLRSIQGPDGDEVIVASRVYHCEACLFFVHGDEDIAETLMNAAPLSIVKLPVACHGEFHSHHTHLTNNKQFVDMTLRANLTH